MYSIIHNIPIGLTVATVTITITATRVVQSQSHYTEECRSAIILKYILYIFNLQYYIGFFFLILS